MTKDAIFITVLPRIVNKLEQEDNPDAYDKYDDFLKYSRLNNIIKDFEEKLQDILEEEKEIGDGKISLNRLMKKLDEFFDQYNQYMIDIDDTYFFWKDFLCYSHVSDSKCRICFLNKEGEPRPYYDTDDLTIALIKGVTEGLLNKNYNECKSFQEEYDENKEALLLLYSFDVINRKYPITTIIPGINF